MWLVVDFGEGLPPLTPFFAPLGGVFALPAPTAGGPTGTAAGTPSGGDSPAALAEELARVYTQPCCSSSEARRSRFSGASSCSSSPESSSKSRSVTSRAPHSAALTCAAAAAATAAFDALLAAAAEPVDALSLDAKPGLVAFALLGCFRRGHDTCSSFTTNMKASCEACRDCISASTAALSGCSSCRFWSLPCASSPTLLSRSSWESFTDSSCKLASNLPSYS